MSDSNPLGLINFKNFYLKPVAFYSKVWGEFDMIYHIHPYYELMLVEEGSCEVKFNDSTGGAVTKTTIQMTKNMAIFINSSIYHKLKVPVTARILHLEFERYEYDKSSGSNDFCKIIENTNLLKLLLLQNSKYYLLKDAYDISSPIKRIHAELMDNIVLLDDNFLLVQAYIVELFIKIAKIHRDNSYKGGISYIKKAIIYIRANYTEHISIAMIAEQLSVSKGYLHKLIKDETGKTLVEIINKFRVEKAKNMIISTTFPLVDIAIECGFNNRQNFYHIFKSIVGVSPQEYRKSKGAYYVSHFEDDYINAFSDEIEID